MIPMQQHFDSVIYVLGSAEIEAQMKNAPPLPIFSEEACAFLAALSARILADVEALHLTPEQVGQFLSMAANGQLPGMGMDPRKSGPTKENAGVEDIAGTGAGQGDSDLKDNDSGEDAEVYGAYSDISRGTEDELTGDREDEYNA